MTPQAQLRPLLAQDPILIHQAFAEQGWNKPISQYEQYLQWQESGQRDIILAEYEGQFAGYLTIQWESDYPPFRAAGIPEVVDFNVLKKYQRRGIGTLLMDEAERRIAQVSSQAGIGFGLYADYGAAQILYIRRGYIPDGQGLVYEGKQQGYGTSVTVDDGLVLYLLKSL